DRLGRLDGGTATTLGRCRVGVPRTGRQLWGAPGPLSPRWHTAQPAWMVDTAVAVRQAATHCRSRADNTLDPTRHDRCAALRPWRAWRDHQQAGAERPLCVYWPPERRSGWPHAHAGGRLLGDRLGRRRPHCPTPQPAAGDLSLEDGHGDAVSDLWLAPL